MHGTGIKNKNVLCLSLLPTACDIIMKILYYRTHFIPRIRAGPRHVDALSNRYSLNFFGLGHGWRLCLRVHAQIADNFRRNS
jgi:hypothetical protein